MKKIRLSLILLSLTLLCFSPARAQEENQNEDISTEKVWRINFLNPGVEYEFPTGTYSTFSINAGVGFGGSYPNLSDTDPGWLYSIAPFLDLQHKWFYNLNNRVQKGYSIDNNSGNFISLRLLSRGPTIESNFTRTTDFDFAIGPTWGIQRSYGNFHLLFDAGFVYYFDTKGNGGFFPLIVQLNLGFDL